VGSASQRQSFEVGHRALQVARKCLALTPRDRELQIGKHYKFELVGTRSTYTLAAQVVELDGIDVVLSTTEKRQLRVPINAVKSAIEQGSAAVSKSISRTQGDVARALREMLRAASADLDALKRTQTISSQLMQEAGTITSKWNRQKASSVIELAQKLERLLGLGDAKQAAEARAAFTIAERNAKKFRGYLARPGTLQAALDQTLE
jgi:hypothetical protein